MSIVAGRMKRGSGVYEDGGCHCVVASKDTACHILINTFIWEHFSSRCYTATETLRLLGDGDLRSLLGFFSVWGGVALWQVCVYSCVFVLCVQVLFLCKKRYVLLLGSETENVCMTTQQH